MISNSDISLFFLVITGTVWCWKYRFPTIFFSKSRNTVLKIFISNPPANIRPPPHTTCISCWNDHFHVVSTWNTRGAFVGEASYTVIRDVPRTRHLNNLNIYDQNFCENIVTVNYFRKKVFYHRYLIKSWICFWYSCSKSSRDLYIICLLWNLPWKSIVAGNE